MPSFFEADFLRFLSVLDFCRYGFWNIYRKKEYGSTCHKLIWMTPKNIVIATSKCYKRGSTKSWTAASHSTVSVTSSSGFWFAVSRITNVRHDYGAKISVNGNFDVLKMNTVPWILKRTRKVKRISTTNFRSTSSELGSASLLLSSRRPSGIVGERGITSMINLHRLIWF